ncbi:MAG TPA: hypothetical protein VJ866_04640 [Pyrinomonadaceae bacterium]|nr:hypothetical protein [Pyrinomonadaceae bacterium]
MSLGNGQDSNGYGALPPIRFEDVAGFDMSDSSNRLYHKPPSEYGHAIWHLGWTDGRHGQPPGDNVALIKARARLAWQERAAAADAQVEETRAVLKSLKGSLDRVGERLKVIAEQHLNLLRERSANPQSYSLSLWFIYSLVAAVLIAADLPLSLKLVAMGYGIESDSWQAVLLASGVALSGILIKYLLDSFVYGEEQEKKKWFVTAPLLLILLLFLGTTFVLGVYRADVEQRTEVERLTRLKSNLEQKQREKFSQATESTINKLKEDIDSANSGGGFWRTGSFIALTLLFPIAGGICFSVGWRKLIRFLRFHSVSWTLWRAESEYKQEELRYERVRGALESLEAKRTRENDDYQNGDAYGDMFVRLYLHGYERGRNVPETADAGASLYDRCEKAVNKLLAGKLRTKYWGLPQPPLP